MKTYLPLILAVLIACQPTAPSPPPPSPWETESTYLEQLVPTLIKQDGPEIHQVWEFPNDSALWGTTMPTFPAIIAYQDSLERAMGTEAFEAGKEILQNPQTGTIDSIYRASHDSKTMIAEGYVGEIRPLHALEAHLLNYQMSRYPLFSQPTEFVSFILTHPNGGVRAYFTASNTLWPPKTNPIFPELNRDTTQGWRLFQCLHNHYEEPEEGYFGIMAPSKPDVQFFRSLQEQYGLPEALITNSFQTTVVRPTDLPWLHGDGE